MKSKILVIAKLINGEKLTTSLEVSNRNINQKDINRLYERLENKINWCSVEFVKITLQLSKNNNIFYNTAELTNTKERLIQCITNYCMISNYEYWDKTKK